MTDSRPKVIDERGRTVILPERVSRILTLQPILTQLVWRLAPHKLLNVDRLFKARLSSFPCPKEDLNLLSSLPVVGVYFDPPDQEQVIALKPDLVATMAGDPNLEAYPEICNCPAIAGNKTNLSDCAVTIRMLGQVVGNSAEGNQLSDYWTSVLKRVRNFTDKLTSSEKLRVYYASHNGLLTTPGVTTIMSSILETAGAIGFSSANPDTNIQPTDEKGSVTLDQVKNWDPEVIITTNNELRQTVAMDSQWRGITAVKNNRVYSNPTEATFDGMKSLMGLIWIATLLYPDKVGIDFSREVHSYQALFNKIKD